MTSLTYKDKVRIEALIDVGRMMGYDINVSLEEDRIDATTFGSTSRTFLAGIPIWQAEVRGGRRPAFIRAIDLDALCNSVIKSMTETIPMTTK